MVDASKTRTKGYLGLLFSVMLLAGRSHGQAASAADIDGGRAEIATPATNLGYPEDWSSHHLVMAGGSAERALAMGSKDPRYVYNMVMHQTAVNNARLALRRGQKKIKVDWAVSLENGFVPQDQSPAKYRFTTNGQNCNTDYLLLALNVTVTPVTQANVVGINNLYTTSTAGCNAGKPWVSFAYNTVTNSGQILTSPTLSVDGTKATFVESSASGSYLHILVLPSPIPVPPAQQGNVITPLKPTTCTKPTTPGCMVTLKFSNTSDSNSSPWIDYNSDTAYVGDDGGKLYKIQPIFGGGTPAVINDTNWPVSVSTSGNRIVTDPIVDVTSNRIFMGDMNGYIYGISLSAPAKTYAARTAIGWVGHGAGTSVVDGPIVVSDPSNPGTNQVFAFTGCSVVVGIGGAISQVPANFTSSTSCANRTGCTTVDLGSSDGQGNCTTANAHNGTFDNAFWLNGTASGHMMGCGFANAGGVASTPQMYFFPFTAAHQITSTGMTGWSINSSTADECSPLTEFYDGTTDRAFFGVGGRTLDGFIESSVLTSSASTANCSNPPTSSCVTAPIALGGTSAIVIDNAVSGGGTNLYFTTLAPGSVNGQKCNVAGGTANPYCAVQLTQAGLQ